MFNLFNNTQGKILAFINTAKAHKITTVILTVLVLSIPVLVYQVQQQQNLSQHAASTAEPIALSFSPVSHTLSIGDTLNVGLVLDAGSNDVGSMQFKMTYDPTLLQVTPGTEGTALQSAQKTNTNGVFNDVMLNANATPVTGNGLNLINFQVKALAAGTATLTIDPGVLATASDSVSYLQIVNPNNMVGTYTISTTVPTPSPTPSAGAPTATPTPTGAPIVTPTPTGAPTPSPSPTGIPTPTPTSVVAPTPTPTTVVPTNTPIPTATPTPGQPTGGSVTIMAMLPGIGTNTSIGENNSPLHPTRKFTVYAFDKTNKLAATTQTDLNYNNGTYTGTASFSNLPNGPYTVKVRSDNSLIKIIPGIYNLAIGGAPTPTAPVTLVTGDIVSTGDSANVLDISDYNALLASFGKSGANVGTSDLNDDGKVDEKDLNILLRGFATRVGD